MTNKKTRLDFNFKLATKKNELAYTNLRTKKLNCSGPKWAVPILVYVPIAN